MGTISFRGAAGRLSPHPHRDHPRSFLSRIFAALARALGALRTGVSSIYGHLSDAVSEAAEPITLRLPWARDRLSDAGDVAARAPGYAAIAAGKVLSVPGAVLGALGALIPAGAPTPNSVADQAVEDDDFGSNRVHTAADMQASLYRSAAEALHAGDEAELRKTKPYVSEHVVEWLRSLDRRDLAIACRLDPAVLARHATAERLSECSPLLPALPHLQPKASPRDEIEAMIQHARRIRAAEDREFAAMSRRGVRAAQEPTWDDEPVYAPRSGYAH